MILLVTPSQTASQCATALLEATAEEVTAVESLARASIFLRSESFLAVVFDQYLLEAEPREAENALGQLGGAIPIQLNLAICGRERLVREVRSALRRRLREEIRARQAAVGKLQSEVNGTVTALLLSSELALEIPGISPAVAERLESVHSLIRKFRNQLEAAAN